MQWRGSNRVHSTIKYSSLLAAIEGWINSAFCEYSGGFFSAFCASQEAAVGPEPPRPTRPARQVLGHSFRAGAEVARPNLTHSVDWPPSTDAVRKVHSRDGKYGISGAVTVGLVRARYSPR